jgi:hypothetical protein
MIVDRYSLFGFLLVPIFTALAIGIVVGSRTSDFTTLSIILSTVTIGLAIAIFAFQQKQGEQIREIARRSEGILGKQETEKQERLNYLFDSLRERLPRINGMIQYNESLYSNFSDDDDNNRYVDSEMTDLINNVSGDVERLKKHLDVAKGILSPNLEEKITDFCDVLEKWYSMTNPYSNEHMWRENQKFTILQIDEILKEIK